MRKKTFFLITGLIPVLIVIFSHNSFEFLIYSIFAFTIVFKYQLQNLIQNIPLSPRLKFFFTAAILGLLTESLAWYGEYLIKSPTPILLHPQLFPNLITSLGLYPAIALGWLIIFRWFKFNPLQLFICQGIFGVLLEQQGQIFLMGIIQFPLGLYYWVFVFLVYAPILTIPFLLLENQLIQGEKNSWYKYPLAVLILGASSILGLIVWSLFLNLIQILPPKKSIVDHPWW